MELYEGIPTYYVELIKQHKEEIRHLEARWNQLNAQRHNAINAGKGERAQDIIEQMTDNFTRQRILQRKIDSYTKCQCSACKV